MNLPTSSVRGFFEMLMPGIFLILNFLFTLFLFSSILPAQFLIDIQPLIDLFSNPALALLLLVVLGYPTGVVLRLLKTERIDLHSAKFIGFRKPKSRGKSYLSDIFFYGNWMRDKVNHRLPEEVSQFYNEFWGDKYSEDGVSNTTFFNFCKTIVAKVDVQSGADIYGAEAITRFIAGSYYALLTSVFLMIINTIYVGFHFSLQTMVVPLLITIGYLYMISVILAQFRLLRCKEVDSVFNACFANRKFFEELFPTPKGRLLIQEKDLTEYSIRRELIFRSWNQKTANQQIKYSVRLDDLIKNMKLDSKKYPFLSSLYFAGSDVDHPFFIENSKIALGLAVLPEDIEKAKVAKRHPHQVEIVIVLSGSLCLSYENDGKIENKMLNEYDFFIIPKGTIHWIIDDEGKDAVYLFIKTNPSEEPRGEIVNF